MPSPFVCFDKYHNYINYMQTLAAAWIIRVFTAQCQISGVRLEPVYRERVFTVSYSAPAAAHWHPLSFSTLSSYLDRALTTPNIPAFQASDWSLACQPWPLIGWCQLTNTMSYVNLWQLLRLKKLNATHFQRHYSDDLIAKLYFVWLDHKCGLMWV